MHKSYRYDGRGGRTDPTMRKNGKVRRQREAVGQRTQAELLGERSCGHLHTENGYKRCKAR